MTNQHLHPVRTPRARTRPQRAAVAGPPRSGPTGPVGHSPLDAPRRQRSRRALLLEGVHADAVVVLRDAGFEVDRRSGALDEDELVAAVRGAALLGVRSRTRVTRRVLAAADELRAVGAFCAGTDQIDLDAAGERGIAVVNAPHSNTRSVAELALAEIIALTRRLPERNAAMHAGTWDKTATGSHEVRGRRLGIVGYGNVGGQLSVLAEAVGMSVVFHDVADRQPLGNARRCSSLEQLLAQSDVVSLHVDGDPANAGLFGDRQLAAMRPGSLLLNLSRGLVVEQAALRRRILDGHLAGAAIDVFPDEPARSGESFDCELRGLPNVILTPHIGGSTEEAQQDIAVTVATRLRDHAHRGAAPFGARLPDHGVLSAR